jgi:hypothetical protein
MGVECQIKVSDTAPEKGTSHIVSCEWTGKPKQNQIRQYIGWMNSVNQTLADEWGIKLMHIFQTKPHWTDFEIWVYEPGKQPRLTK